MDGSKSSEQERKPAGRPVSLPASLLLKAHQIHVTIKICAHRTSWQIHSVRGGDWCTAPHHVGHTAIPYLQASILSFNCAVAAACL